LAALEGASAARIATFASVHGFLRRHGGDLLGVSGPESAALTLAVGQEAVDDSTRVQEWLDQGAPGAPPKGTEDTVAYLALLTTYLPDSFFDAFDAILDGTAVPRPITLPDFIAIAVPVAAAAPAAGLPYLAEPGGIRAIEPARLRRALRINEWVSHMIAGLEPVPDSLAAIGSVDAMLRLFTANLPEAYSIPELLDGPDGPVIEYMRSRATETVDDWRAAASALGTRVRALDLIRSALAPDGLSSADKRELASVYTGLAGYRSPLDLSAAEIADRLQPLLARSLESELASIGAWPIPRGTLAGLYVRALFAVWTELMQASTPKTCATPGCLGAAPPTRNRRYCDQCQSTRARDRTRRSRQRAQPTPGAGPG
jgi:hypothetical protein